MIRSLILDEPVAGLDPLAREEFLDGVLRTICQRGQTVLFSSHTLDDVRRLADTVGILYEGRLLVHGRIDDILDDHQTVARPASMAAGPRTCPRHNLRPPEGREWLLTVGDFSPEKAQHVRALDGVEHVEVIDLGLEDFFKDIVKGQRAHNELASMEGLSAEPSDRDRGPVYAGSAARAGRDFLGLARECQ